MLTIITQSFDLQRMIHTAFILVLLVFSSYSITNVTIFVNAEVDIATKAHSTNEVRASLECVSCSDMLDSPFGWTHLEQLQLEIALQVLLQ